MNKSQTKSQTTKSPAKRRVRSLRADQLTKRTYLAVYVFASGLKLEVIANAAGISTSFLSGIISGKHVPSEEALERIAFFLCIANPARLLETVSSEDLTAAVRALLGLEDLYAYPGSFDDPEVDITGRPDDAA